jgi:predicted NUDIX family phosphoesterase
MQEKVLVVPADAAQQFLVSSFRREAAEGIIHLANSTRIFRPRSEVEQDESVKQIIPYVCIRSGNAYVLLQRTNKQSEARLHNKFSLGIGGHINDIEETSGTEDLVYAGMMRELTEEIHLSPGWKLEVLGAIYDATTDVGRVHLGIAYELQTSDRQFALNELDLMTGRWIEARELAQYRDRMETWSQILFDHRIADSIR